MEKVFKQIKPIDVFITNIEAGILNWRSDEVKVIKNRTTGNELIDKVAELLSIHHMRSTQFYEKALGMRQGTLYPMMLLYSGLSFREWRNQYIMLSAKEWLTETDYKLDVIGKRLGFSSIHTFSKWFIRTEDIAPIYWRKYAKEMRRKQDAEHALQWKKENYKRNCETQSTSI